jgi:hypothetical protein
VLWLVGVAVGEGALMAGVPIVATSSSCRQNRFFFVIVLLTIFSMNHSR